MYTEKQLNDYANGTRAAIGPVQMMQDISKKLSPEEIRKPKNHHADWLDCIRNGKQPLAHVEAGHRTSTLCQLANIGYELRRELDWDPKTESFPKDKDAQALVDRKRRKQWYRI